MALILLSRVPTGVFFDGDEYYDSNYFNTLDPGGLVITFRALDTTGFELALDELVWTDPGDGDEYFYDGNDNVYRTPGAGIPLPVYPDISTSYGLRFNLEYFNWLGQTVKDEIYKKDYEGAAVDVDGGAEPFVLSRENDTETNGNFI